MNGYWPRSLPEYMHMASYMQEGSTALDMTCLISIGWYVRHTVIAGLLLAWGVIYWPGGCTALGAVQSGLRLETELGTLSSYPAPDGTCLMSSVPMSARWDEILEPILIKLSPVFFSLVSADDEYT